MSGRYVLIVHGDEPPDDRVRGWMTATGRPFQVVRPFAGEALPAVDGSVLGSFIYGGPFNVFEEDRHPFLRDENAWVEACLAAEVPLIAACQGAQTIAHVLGARVGPLAGEPTEFGYYPVHPTPAGQALFGAAPRMLTQSHYHGFDLPAGATLLAWGETFAHQAFAYGSALAFQFHAEATPATFRRWQDAPWARYGRPGAQTRAEQDALMAAHDGAQHDWFLGVLAGHFRR